jgi:hypothetical protein
MGASPESGWLFINYKIMRDFVGNWPSGATTTVTLVQQARNRDSVNYVQPLRVMAR